jgi:NAD(P)-dependent dehydrogenase (short-subunit alcohol dehydrogenase family)
MTEFAKLDGKRALITGADRGIGAGIARALAAQGAGVFLNTFQPVESCKHLTDEIHAFAHQADVRDEQSVQQLFRAMVEQFGGIDILVNNAGVESIVPALDLTMEEWDRVHLTNLRGAFLCSQAAARLMKSQSTGGVIVNISSIHGNIPRLGTAHYSTAKAGLSMMTKSLAQEWAEYGIRVVGVSPGAIETEINRDSIAAIGRKRFEEWIPLGRIGVVDDVANAVAFLASDQASYISGTTLFVDGAYSLNGVQYDLRKKHTE